jgi:hypothetical protein
MKKPTAQKTKARVTGDERITMRKLTLIALFICLPMLAKADDFDEYSKLTTKTLERGNAQNCGAFKESLDYWAKANEAQLSGIEAAKAGLARSVRGAGLSNPEVREAKSEVEQAYLVVRNGANWPGPQRTLRSSQRVATQAPNVEFIFQCAEIMFRCAEIVI